MRLLPTFASLLLTLPGIVHSSVRGEETKIECSAIDKGISHDLVLVERNGTLAHISYTSVNNAYGSDCGVEAGDVTQADAIGSVWQRWQDIIVVRMKDNSPQNLPEDQTIVVLKQIDGYRVSVSNYVGIGHCGNHGYLAPTVFITRQSKHCKLVW